MIYLGYGGIVFRKVYCKAIFCELISYLTTNAPSLVSFLLLLYLCCIFLIIDHLFSNLAQEIALGNLFLVVLHQNKVIVGK